MASSASIEDRIRAAQTAGDLRGAAATFLESYGPEILNFLHSRLRRDHESKEVYGAFTEDLWRALPSFEWRCTARAFGYHLARNAANRHCKRLARRRKESPLSPSSLVVAANGARSSTRPWLRTTLKERIRALRERLGSNDQMILILHVDRGLPWQEIAVVTHPEGEHLEGERLTREATRLRKRFERIKATLRELAIGEGLLPAG